MTGIMDSKLQQWMQRQRGTRDLSQEQFGAQTGWSQAAIQAWETGVRGMSKKAYRSMVEWATREGAEPPPDVDWASIPQVRKGAANVRRMYLTRNVRQIARTAEGAIHPALLELRGKVTKADPLLDENWGARRDGGPDGGPLLTYQVDFLSDNLAAHIVVLPDEAGQVVAVRRGNRDKLWDLLRLRDITSVEQAVLVYLLLGAETLLEQVRRVVQVVDHEASKHGVRVVIFTTTQDAADYIVENA